MSVRRPRFSGFMPENDPLHYVLGSGDPGALIEGTGRILAPGYVEIYRGKKVPQWASTVESEVKGFDPANDCDGYFMSSLFQPNNNCYNYACNIATNSFAIPGRRNNFELVPDGQMVTAERTIKAAIHDKLVFIGVTPMTLAEALVHENYLSARARFPVGHLVALLISGADSTIPWPGDFHWIRSDHLSGELWSQKDGPDQVTNFDFAGHRITDPSRANWRVNLGPQNSNTDNPLGKVIEGRTEYHFEAWMYVPFHEVSII
jgi:hypothetical protein